MSDKYKENKLGELLDTLPDGFLFGPHRPNMWAGQMDYYLIIGRHSNPRKYYVTYTNIKYSDSVIVSPLSESGDTLLDAVVSAVISYKKLNISEDKIL